MRHTNRVFLCCCLLLVLNIAASAQDNQNVPAARGGVLVEPVASYGDVPWPQERRQLDSLAAFLSQDPNLVGYIVVYAGRRACAGEAQARALRAKKYLVERRGVAGDRLIWRDAGHLRRPHVILETQLRGGILYPYTHPEPLPPKEVQVLKCSGLTGRRR